MRVEFRATSADQDAEGEFFEEWKAQECYPPEIRQDGLGRNKASRGWETLKAQRIRGWKPGVKSLPDSLKR
jgi:hypothetical protein